MRAFLVVNPASRRGGQSGDAVRAELARLGVEIVQQWPSTGAVDAIVVAGGDGTLVGEIPRAIEHGVPIGLVPLGTFNDLARTLSIPLDIERACALIAAGHTRTIDAARVNGRCYVTEASVGLSSRLTRLQRPVDKQRFGLLAAAASLLQAVRFARPFHVEIVGGGQRTCLRAIQVTVANSPRFAAFIVDPTAAIDDGRLDCYCVELRSALDFFSIAAAIARRRRSAQGLRTFRAEEFEVRTRRPHRISADGEPAGTTPARFEILRNALRIFAPPP
ncbi:MAG: YegS/Rv2252/BmrU family lipid kinase [Candidatus Eremiobacteraeota bacterium]|nr:YegS/Rv2252/BmrU family lipid kinase [Candidatus Eremiobacteraeota bacterium]